MGQHHMHAEPSHQADHALRYGQRFSVRRRIGPAHGNLLAPEVVRAAKMSNEVHGISHGLRRVVDIALEIYDGRALLQDPGGVPFLHCPGDFPHVGIALPDVHVVPNPDHLGHEGHHVRGLPHCFAVRNLALAFIQVLDRKAEQVARAGEAKPGPRRVIAEDADRKTAVEDLEREVLSTYSPQEVCRRKDRRQLVVGLFPGEEEIRRVQAAAFQRCEFLNR